MLRSPAFFCRFSLQTCRNTSAGQQTNRMPQPKLTCLLLLLVIAGAHALGLTNSAASAENKICTGARLISQTPGSPAFFCCFSFYCRNTELGSNDISTARSSQTLTSLLLLLLLATQHLAGVPAAIRVLLVLRGRAGTACRAWAGQAERAQQMLIWHSQVRGRGNFIQPWAFMTNMGEANKGTIQRRGT